MFAKHFIFSFSTAAALLSAGALSTAFAGPAPADYSKDKKAVVKENEPKWYISLGAGAEFDLGATRFSERSRTGFVSPDAGFAIGAGSVSAQKYNDVYDVANLGIHAELGYVVSKNGEIFGSVKYSHGFADTVQIGTGNFGIGNEPIFANFDDYNSIGVEAGFRYFFLPKTSRIRPYVSFAAGATYVFDIDTNFFLADGTPVFGTGFYQGGVVATGALLGGIEFALSRNFSIGAESGLRYEFPLSERDRDLDRSGLNNSLNNSGDRFYVPVRFYGKFRF
jgi:hypothetical protein